jgi:hypothetical protein
MRDDKQKAEPPPPSFVTALLERAEKGHGHQLVGKLTTWMAYHKAPLLRRVATTYAIRRFCELERKERHINEHLDPLLIDRDFFIGLIGEPAAEQLQRGIQPLPFWQKLFQFLLSHHPDEAPVWIGSLGH